MLFVRIIRGVVAVTLVATDTPTSTNTPTQTSTPTQTPTPAKLLGDVNLDTFINSIDALFILQFDARLLGTLPNASNADVNCDAAVNAVDAALILPVRRQLPDGSPRLPVAGERARQQPPEKTPRRPGMMLGLLLLLWDVNLASLRAVSVALAYTLINAALDYTRMRCSFSLHAFINAAR